MRQHARQAAELIDDLGLAAALEVAPSDAADLGRHCQEH